MHTAKQCNVDTEPVPKRKEMLNKRLDRHSVMSSIGRDTDQNKDTFCTFYPVLDNMLSEINRQFSKPNCEIMKGIQALNPASAKLCDDEAVFLCIYL